MKQFKKIKDLYSYMGECTVKTLDKVADVALEKLKENVQSSVYKSNPKEYERTYDVLNCISKTKAFKEGNRIYVMVYFDLEKINVILRMPAHWNAHAAMEGDSVVEMGADNLIMWLENGTKNPYYSHPEHKFIANTVAYLQREYKSIFMECMKKV